MDDLDRTRKLVAEARWQLMPEEMVIAAFPREAGSRVLAALAGVAGVAPLWWGDDGFEVTVVAPREALEAGGPRSAEGPMVTGGLDSACGGPMEPGGLGSIPGARVEAGWALLTCLTPLPWDVVGFLAGVTARLAQAGITCGALSAYSHDHLLVPWARREEALRLLMRGDGPGSEPGEPRTEPR